jgi:hypothetical protein
VDGRLAYSLAGISRYDDLRSETIATPRILVVLFLPQDPTQWISQTDQALSLHKCAYWVSLRGAAPSSNASAQTVYLPQGQRFDIPSLTSLFELIARGALPTYQPPAT